MPSEPISKLRELIDEISHFQRESRMCKADGLWCRRCELEALLPALEQQLKFWKDAAYRLEETIRLLRTEGEA